MESTKCQGVEQTLIRQKVFVPSFLEEGRHPEITIKDTDPASSPVS